MENPGGFSISMALRTPPRFGAWAAGTPTAASTTSPMVIDSSERRLTGGLYSASQTVSS
jgi:hypothetical protein